MSLKRKQVYIVDDDESVCRALKILLTNFGFEVTTFPTSEEFFSAVPNSAQGCLLLDIHLPGLDGREALKRIIKSKSQRPIIIITADKDAEVKKQVLETGVTGFLQKPFQDHELVCLINKSY